VFALDRVGVIRCRSMKPCAALATVFGLMCWAMLAPTASAQANTGVGALLGPAATSAEPFPELAAIEAQLTELASRPDAEVAAVLIETSRRALQRARVLAAEGHTAAAERAQQVAWAAFAAASHTIARHHAEAERAATERRKAIAQTAAAAARQALDHARAQASSIEAPQP